MTLSEWDDKPEKWIKKTCWCLFLPGVKVKEGQLTQGRGWPVIRAGQLLYFAGADHCTCVNKRKAPRLTGWGLVVLSGNYCLDGKSFQNRTFHGWKFFLSHALAKKWLTFHGVSQENGGEKLAKKSEGKLCFFSVCLARGFTGWGLVSLSGNYCLYGKSFQNRTFHGWKVFVYHTWNTNSCK